MYVCALLVCTAPMDVVRCPETKVTYSCEPPHGYQELNLGLLEKQSVLLNAEPSLQCTHLELCAETVKHVSGNDFGVSLQNS